MKRFNLKYIIWALVCLIFLGLTVYSFVIYMDSNIYNKSVILVDMSYVGDKLMPSKVNVSFITGKIGTRGNTSFYLVGDSEHIYVMATDKPLPKQLEEIKDYSYMVTDIKPKSYQITGFSYEIEPGLQNLALNAYNDLFKTQTIDEKTFKELFGQYYINIEEIYDNSETLKLVLFISFAICTFLSVFSMVFYYSRKTLK